MRFWIIELKNIGNHWGYPNIDWVKKIGLSRISINKIETGKIMPTLKIANDIANALGVCIYKIFDLDGTGEYRCADCDCVHIQ